MKVKDKALEIEIVNKALSDIHFFELDNTIVNFYKDNINYFCSNSTDVEIINGRGFKMVTMDDSIFKIDFMPSYTSPSRINMELINLSGNSSRKYTIKFDLDSMSVICRGQYADDSLGVIKLRKSYDETKYIDQKKAYNKKVETYIRSDCFGDFTKQEETFYPELDSLYYRSSILIGEYYNTSIKYTKGYSFDSSKEIGEEEFKNNIHKKQNKVLKIIFKK